MKLTNNFNLPDTFVNVIKRPQYDKGDSQISATEILNSPRIVQLKRKHWDDLSEDASDMVWSLFGSAVHNILQHGKDDHHVVEQRIFTEFHGWKISGAIDLQEVYEDGIVISDYKVTGAWAAQNGKQDWITQLNLYAWLVERVKQQKVKALKIVTIIRDWSRRDAQSKPDYPQSPVWVIDIPLWNYEDREAFIRRRLDMHNDAFFAAHAEGEMPLCSSDDMWEKPTMYAIKKEGNVRAKSVFEDRQEAEEALKQIEYAAKKGEKFFLEVREGSRTRCEGFCQVAPFCSQYKDYQSAKESKGVS